jgi:AbrB family looped-hinge helix DNA binding protein
MGHKVGAKGQLVIEKAIRDQLGIEPGSESIQRVVDGRLEIVFRRPRHRRSLLGAARPFIKRWPTQEEIDHPEQAWGEAVAKKLRRLDEEARG